MQRHPNKNTKNELRQQDRLTRPPRMEGKAKNAGADPVRKKKRPASANPRPRKPQGYDSAQRRDYQLKSKRRR